MKPIPHGGYAYPCTIEHLQEPVTAGMTLRDIFAAKALPSALTILMHDYTRDMEGWSWSYSTDNALLADLAYEMADAMLKAREVK